MGADRAILLSDRAFAGADTWVTSLVLSQAVVIINPDLVICGRQAIDGDTAQVGPEMAEHLGLPSVAYVGEIEMKSDRTLLVKRMYEDGFQRIKVNTPCLLTVLKELNEPRYMRVSRIFNAYKDGLVETWDNSQLGFDPVELGLKGSPTKVKKSYTKGAKTAGKVFDVSPKEAAKIIVDKLKENYIL
jgi:electron transfer flavoprotein beta subunit